MDGAEEGDEGEQRTAAASCVHVCGPNDERPKNGRLMEDNKSRTVGNDDDGC